MGFISHHITPLVINSLGGRHTHTHTNKHTHTQTHTHIQMSAQEQFQETSHAPGLTIFNNYRASKPMLDQEMIGY